VVAANINGASLSATPSGWNVAVTHTTASASRVHTYWRALDGTATDNFSGSTGATTVTSGLIYAAFSGVDTTTAMDAAGTYTAGTSGAAITVATAGAWVLHAVGASSSSTGVVTPAPGFTEILEVDGRCTELAYDPDFPTGSTGAITPTGTVNVVVVFALRPGGGGGAPEVIPSLVMAPYRGAR
jgi:hypothetical protein